MNHTVRRFGLGAMALAGILALAMPAGASPHKSKAPVGIGSTAKQWAVAYGMGHGVCGDCYGTLVHNGDSGKQWMYSGVSFGPVQANHVALMYMVNTATHTPWDVVQGFVMRMLPKDAVLSPLSGVTVEHDGSDECGVFTATSAALAHMAAMTNPLPKDESGEDPTGIVEVSMSTLDSDNNEVYFPNNVQTTTVIAGDLPPGEAC